VSGGPRAAIHARRAELVVQAERERDQVAAAFAPWRRPLAMIDRGMNLVATLRRRAPFLGAGIGVAATVLAVVRPSRLADWLSRGQAALSLIRRLKERF
jgi:hypothetical protein